MSSFFHQDPGPRFPKFKSSSIKLKLHVHFSYLHWSFFPFPLTPWALLTLTSCLKKPNKLKPQNRLLLVVSLFVVWSCAFALMEKLEKEGVRQCNPFPPFFFFEFSVFFDSVTVHLCVNEFSTQPFKYSLFPFSPLIFRFLTHTTTKLNLFTLVSSLQVVVTSEFYISLSPMTPLQPLLSPPSGLRRIGEDRNHQRCH